MISIVSMIRRGSGRGLVPLCGAVNFREAPGLHAKAVDLCLQRLDFTLFHPIFAKPSVMGRS